MNVSHYYEIHQSRQLGLTTFLLILNPKHMSLFQGELNVQLVKLWIFLKMSLIIHQYENQSIVGGSALLNVVPMSMHPLPNITTTLASMFF